MSLPSFPPLLHGQATVDAPLTVAVDMARAGCDGGTLVYNLTGNALHAAIVFAPEVSLTAAMAMLPVCGIGFQNALGAIAPPEVAVHIKWDGTIMVNGAACGGLRAVAATCPPDQTPDWLVVGVTVPIWDANDAPGDTPDVTSLYAEGCGDLAAIDLLEAWARHTLVWINRWMDEGAKPIHNEFSGLWHKDGDAIGLDADFGLLRKSGDITSVTPLTDVLETL